MNVYVIIIYQQLFTHCNQVQPDKILGLNSSEIYRSPSFIRNGSSEGNTNYTINLSKFGLFLAQVPIRVSIMGGNSFFLPPGEKNSSIPPFNFEMDYYPEPYGAYINSVKSAEKRFSFGPLIFGFARFNNMKPNYLENQNPLFKDAIDLADTSEERTDICEKGFFHHMEFCSNEFGFITLLIS